MADRAGPGYAIAGPGERGDGSLTDRLACTETWVAAHRPSGGVPAALPADRERLCVPLDGPGTLGNGGESVLEPRSIACCPAGAPASLAGEGTTWLVVGAPAAPARESRVTVLALDALSYRVPETSSVPIARLTDRLGCVGMKVNVRRLAPGMVVPYHTEGTQEELFVPLDGPGTLRAAGEEHPMAPGDVARVAPDCPRSAVNHGPEPVRWLMVGAPPTGAPDEWDPGAEHVSWPGD